MAGSIAYRRHRRTLVRLLRGSSVEAPRWRCHQGIYERAVWIVRVYYLISLFMLYERSRWLSALDRTSVELDLLWPVQWLDRVGLEIGGPIIAQYCLAAGVLGLLFWRYRVVRVLVSIALLQFMALKNSFGSMGHGYHTWFWVSVAFWFLPAQSLASIGATRIGRMRFLLGFSMAPLMVLFFYSLSGAYKLVNAILALSTGKVSAFAPDAMAITLAWRSLETVSDPLWAKVIIESPLLGWPLYVGLYYVEVFALVAFFRPQLHQLWGLLLMGFHFGTLLFMDITFPEHVLINSLLLFMSPFALGLVGWRGVVAALPLFGRLLRGPERRTGPSCHARAHDRL